MRIREVIRKIRMRKIYYGANRIAYIGENVSLPNNIRVPGGKILSYKTMRALVKVWFLWHQMQV